MSVVLFELFFRCETHKLNSGDDGVQRRTRLLDSSIQIVKTKLRRVFAPILLVECDTCFRLGAGLSSETAGTVNEITGFCRK